MERITVQEVLKKHPRELIMKLILHDRTFQVVPLHLQIQEVKKYKHYLYDIYAEEKHIGSDEVILETYEDGREWHAMYKKPQNIYAVGIMLTGTDDVKLFIHHEPGAAANGVLVLTEKIIGEYLTVREIQTMEDMDNHVKKYETELRGEQLLKKKIREHK